MYHFLLGEAKSYLQNVGRASRQKEEPSIIAKQAVTSKLLHQIQKQKKIKQEKNRSVRVVVVGLVSGAKQQDVVGSAKMETNKPIVVALASVIVIGTIGSFGMVIQRWTEWTTTTLISLDKKQAVIEQKIESTNDLIAQNHEMLKALMGASTQKTFYKATNE